MQRFALLLIFGAALLCRNSAAAPSEASDQIIGNPLALEVEPKTIILDGPRAGQQVLVTGRYADGSLRDLTRTCKWQTAGPDLLAVTAHGFVTGHGDGTTHIEIRAAGLQTRVPVMIRNSRQSQLINFRHEVMPVLSSAGCSDIRCHGAPSGKDGFRLSLWGSNPDLDYQQLTRDAFGRRTSSLAPDTGLILLKPLARVPHVGGQRFTPDSPFAQLLRDWQAEGLRDDRHSSKLRSLTVLPARRVLHAPARRQQLAVRATFDDGGTADITHLTAYSSTDLGIAKVNRTGLVEFRRQGEVAILCRFLGEMVSVRLMHIASPPPDYRWPHPPENNYVDRHVFAKLELLHIAPSELCSDEQFVRRLYLDVCGILPTPTEAQAFVAATEPDKRARMIERLLQRPEYADFWTKKWMDVLRVSRDSIQLAGAQAYHGWLREQIENDASFAGVVRTLLTSQGQSYRDPPVNFFCVVPTPEEIKDPQYLQKDLAEATAQLFLGVRLQCAQCHNHPFERWTQDDYLALAAFFTQVKRSRLGKAGRKGRPDRRQMAIALDFNSAEITRTFSGQSMAPAFLGEATPDIAPQQDRRWLLADWMTKDDNPFFSKAVVNRIWFHLHGRGIVEPVDDFRDSNPAANDALLDALAEEFVASGFSLKSLIRTIVSSRTYQLSALPNKFNRTDTRYFSHVLARPLPAEVLMDAICEVTAVHEAFEIMKDYIMGIPTESMKLPAGTRAVQLPVTDIVTLINTSGKYVRYESNPFLRTFGQPNRTQTCECDREQKFTRKQALELIVGPMVTTKLAHANNRLGQMLARNESDTAILNELYLRALSRAPSQDTSKALLGHVAKSDDKRRAWEDVLWTILNSQEFIYQH